MCETKIGVTAGKKKRPPVPSVEPEGRLCPSKNLARASKRDFIVPLPLCTIDPYMSLTVILSSTCAGPVLLDLCSLLIPNFIAAPRLIFQSDRRSLYWAAIPKQVPRGTSEHCRRCNTLGATDTLINAQETGTEEIRPTATGLRRFRKPTQP